MLKEGLTALILAGALAPPATAEVVTAAGSVELTDATGDVAPFHTPTGDFPGFDVVKLALASDGKTLSVTATLKSAPGGVASPVVELFFDTDNNAATGAALTSPKARGFEYQARIDACAEYTGGASACEGSFGKAKATKHWSAFDLERFKGAEASQIETVVAAMGIGDGKPSPHTPIVGKVVRAVIDYADLGVKPGQTMRVLAREACGIQAEDGGLFSEVVLTLN